MLGTLLVTRRGEWKVDSAPVRVPERRIVHHVVLLRLARLRGRHFFRGYLGNHRILMYTELRTGLTRLLIPVQSSQRRFRFASLVGEGHGVRVDIGHDGP